MTNETTLNKLIEMRFTAMADSYRSQLQDSTYANLSFEERIGLLVDIEYNNRKNNRLHRLIKNASFDQLQACVADINHNAGRKLNKAEINRLASCDYVTNRHNIIILGATGAGKTYLACAFGIEACKQFYTVKYVRLPELLAELAMARGEGNYKKMFQQYRKANLLILDEWMLVSLTETEARDILEIVHARHKRASTIFCSQFAPAG
jgi:DNA replication protein DnaC